MRPRGILILPWLGMLAACPAEDAADATRSIVVPSRAAVMDKVYDPTYTVPGGFLEDARAATPTSYAVHHVMDETVSYELCANSLPDALALEQADHASRDVQGQFVEALENTRYFEIVRELSFDQSIGNAGQPAFPGFARVFRCDYVTRSGVDRTDRDGYAGRLRPAHVSATELRIVTEYLWQFTWFWPAEKKVLVTFSDESARRFQHTLVLALRTAGADGRCDRIEVVDWLFSLDKTSGDISKTFTPLYAFDADLVDGSPSECP